VADGLELVDELGVGEERGHGAEREPAEVLVEPGRNHTRAPVGQLERGLDDGRLEELHLVDADNLGVACADQKLRHGRDGDGMHPDARVAHDVAHVVAVVDRRLEDRHALTRDLGPAEPTDHLLALAAEHGAADDLEPAASLRGDPDHGRDPMEGTGRSDRPEKPL
jgi:hypothetical protein